MISLQKKLFGKRYFDRRIYLFMGAIMAVIAFDLVAIYYSWYYAYSWLDIPVHMVAGCVLALLLYYSVFANTITARVFRTIYSYSPEHVFSVMIFWVLVTALTWEIVEFVWGRTILSPNYAFDLFSDIAVTSAGSLIAYSYIRLFRMKV